MGKPKLRRDWLTVVGLPSNYLAADTSSPDYQYYSEVVTPVQHESFPFCCQDFSDGRLGNDHQLRRDCLFQSGTRFRRDGDIFLVPICPGDADDTGRPGNQ